VCPARDRRQGFSQGNVHPIVNFYRIAGKNDYLCKKQNQEKLFHGQNLPDVLSPIISAVLFHRISLKDSKQ
jgi:hypothetical protein